MWNYLFTGDIDLFVNYWSTDKCMDCVGGKKEKEKLKANK